jgi:hypothetical protein
MYFNYQFCNFRLQNRLILPVDKISSGNNVSMFSLSIVEPLNSKIFLAKFRLFVFFYEEKFATRRDPSNMHHCALQLHYHFMQLFLDSSPNYH